MSVSVVKIIPFKIILKLFLSAIYISTICFK